VAEEYGLDGPIDKEFSFQFYLFLYAMGLIIKNRLIN